MTPFHERSVGGRRSSRAAVTAAATLVAAATLGAPVRAQLTLSRISGRVIDETGAPIAGAVVRADSRGDSPGAFTTTTSEKGEFAILGLRALYTALEHNLRNFPYLHYGLSGVLAFAGIKLIFAEWMKLPPLVSVAIITAIITSSIWASMRAKKKS